MVSTSGPGDFPPRWYVLYALAGLGAGSVALTPLVMVRAFPAAVRFTGVSFSYNIAYAVFGGVTPLLVSWSGHFDRMSPAHYVAAITSLGLVAILAAPRGYFLDEEPESPRSGLNLKSI